MPIQPPIEWMQDFDRLLTRFVEGADVLADTALPLRWYERAARTGSDVDRFLAAFVGLESLVGARGRHVGVESPIADMLRDPRVSELLQPLRDDYSDDQVDRLIERLQNRNLSLIDQFDVVAASLGLNEDHKAIFRRANRARNPLVHGRDGTIDDERTREALDLLRTMLRAALDTHDA